jgi:hypothetical protein
MDDYLPLALAVVLCINAVLFMGQYAINETAIEIGAPAGVFFDSGGSILCSVEQNNCEGTYIVEDSNPTSRLPSSETIESGDGNLFTDMFASIKNFFSDTLGLKYLVNILSAPKTFLTMLGLPQEISFTLASLWYLFTLFLLLAFLWGR